MNDRPSPFLYRMATWRVHGFVCAALLVFLFTLGSAGNLFATVTSEAEAACEPADVVRVRVGDLDFNLSKERQLKLASDRMQLSMLTLSSSFPARNLLAQKLDGRSAIRPAPFYCQSSEAPRVDVFGFSLKDDSQVLFGEYGGLTGVRKLWISKVESASEKRRKEILLSELGKEGLISNKKSGVRLHKSNVTEQSKNRPANQYFVQLKLPERRLFLVECRRPFIGTIKGDICNFQSALKGTVILKGTFYTNKISKDDWVKALQTINAWYLSLL